MRDVLRNSGLVPAMILSLIPTPYRVAIYAVGLALIAGFSFSAGFKFSEGRHAIWQVKQQDERLDAVYDTLERARAEAQAANEQAAQAEKKLAALDARQQRERIRYLADTPVAEGGRCLPRQKTTPCNHLR